MSTRSVLRSTRRRTLAWTWTRTLTRSPWTWRTCGARCGRARGALPLGSVRRFSAACMCGVASLLGRRAQVARHAHVVPRARAVWCACLTPRCSAAAAAGALPRSLCGAVPAHHTWDPMHRRRPACVRSLEHPAQVLDELQMMFPDVMAQVSPLWQGRLCKGSGHLLQPHCCASAASGHPPLQRRPLQPGSLQRPWSSAQRCRGKPDGGIPNFRPRHPTRTLP